MIKISSITSRLTVIFVFGLLLASSTCNVKESKESSLEQSANDEIIILSIRNSKSNEVFDALELLEQFGPKVVGINFYYDLTDRHELSNFVEIESVIPFDLAEGYLLKDEKLELESSYIENYYTDYIINGREVKSFARQIVEKTGRILKKPGQHELKLKGNWSSFTLSDIPSILENPKLVKNKIVLVGYVGDRTPDPNLLGDHEHDFDIYETEIGLMYETIVQANIISDILNNNLIATE